MKIEKKTTIYWLANMALSSARSFPFPILFSDMTLKNLMLKTSEQKLGCPVFHLPLPIATWVAQVI